MKKWKARLKALGFSLIILCSSYGFAQQGPERFDAEVKQITESTPVPDQGPIYLFTGSSSVRLWKDLPSYFPGKTIVNTGFGGSQTHELLHFAEELILHYHPQKVFIYEGDNDLASGKSPALVLKTMKTLVAKIQEALPEAGIVLISPKPSPSRWHLKKEYNDLNRLLEVYANTDSKVEFANVWDIAINPQGRPKPEIFLEDSLHMNKNGYDDWAKVIGKYLK